MGAPSPEQDEVARKAAELYAAHKKIQEPIEEAQAELKSKRFMGDITTEAEDEAARDKIGTARLEAEPQFTVNRIRAAEFARANLEALQTQAAEDMKADTGEGPDLRPKLDVVPEADSEGEQRAA
jgi:hypothetical protein